MQEESRRLQLQSQMLQQRAMEMSWRMSPGTGTRPAPGAVHSSSTGPNPAGPAVVALSQVSDLQAAMAAGRAGPTGHYPEQQFMTPISQANSVLMSDSDPYLQAGDALVPPDAVLPPHPPGDVTPSSVTSSRAGLHWNIPSRGSIPSPGKVDPYTPSSPGDPRCVAMLAPATDF